MIATTLRSAERAAWLLLGALLCLSIQGAGATREITLPAATFDAAADSVPARLRVLGDAQLARYVLADGSNVRLVNPDGTNVEADLSVTGWIEDDHLNSVNNNPQAYRWRSADGTVDVSIFSVHRQLAKEWAVGSLDNLTGNWTVRTLDNYSDGDTDDHNNPAITIHEPTGTLFVSTPEHNDAEVRIWMSAPGADITTITEIPASQLPASDLIDIAGYTEFFWADDTLCVQWRDNSVTRKWMHSTDLGATWSTPRTMIAVAGQRPYPSTLGSQVNGTDRIDVVYSLGLEKEALPYGISDVLHAYYLFSTDSWYRTDGTLIGDADTVALGALIGNQGTIVMDAGLQSHNLRTAGMAYGPNGELSVAITQVDVPNQRVRYWQARYTPGGNWLTELVVPEWQESISGPFDPGQPGYLPGWRQTSDPNVVLASVYKDLGIEVREYTRVSSGVWTFKVLSKAGGRDKIRPFEVLGHNGVGPKYGFSATEYQFFGSEARSRLCLYPGPHAKVDVHGLAEVDIPGDRDVRLLIEAAPAGPTEPPKPFPAAVRASYGELGFGSRTIWDDNAAVTKRDGTTVSINGLGQFTAVASVVMQSTSSPNELTFLSNYLDFGPDGNFNLRIDDTPDQPQMTFRNSSGGVTINATDLTPLVEGTRYGFATRYSTTDSLVKLAMSGTLSSVTANNGGQPLRTVTTAGGAYAGVNITDQGESPTSIDTLLVLDSTPTDAWLRMASAGVANGAVVGDFEAGGLTVDQLMRLAKIDDLEAQLAKLDTLTAKVDAIDAQVPADLAAKVDQAALAGAAQQITGLTVAERFTWVIGRKRVVRVAAGYAGPLAVEYPGDAINPRTDVLALASVSYNGATDVATNLRKSPDGRQGIFDVPSVATGRHTLVVTVQTTDGVTLPETVVLVAE